MALEVDQDGSRKDDMFNRVHRQARPWADIDVAVMERVAVRHRPQQQNLVGGPDRHAAASVQTMLLRICPPSVNCRPFTISGPGSNFGRLRCLV